MHSEEPPLDRAPDLIVKIRALRDQAERDMNRFTDRADYDVRRVSGRKAQVETVQAPIVTPPKKRSAKKPAQTSMDFVSASAEQLVDGGDPA